MRAWIRHLRRRNLSAHTIATYSWALRDLGTWLQSSGIATASDLNREHLHLWQDTLHARNLQPVSRASAASAVRGLLRWAAREQLGIEPGLWEHVDRVSVPDTDPRVLEAADVRRVLAHYSQDRRDLAWLRDRALFLFLLTSGARITEALSVDRNDVDRRMVVRQKGGGEHVLVISERTRTWVAEYLRCRGPDDVAALWIVDTRNGRRRAGGDDVNAIWAALAGRLGIPRFTSHWLRGTNATELNVLGYSDVDKASHLGHRDTSTIHRYTRLRPLARKTMVDQLDELLPPAPRPPLLPPIRRKHRRRPPR